MKYLAIVLGLTFSGAVSAMTVDELKLDLLEIEQSIPEDVMVSSTQIDEIVQVMQDNLLNLSDEEVSQVIDGMLVQNNEIQENAQTDEVLSPEKKRTKAGKAIRAVGKALKAALVATGKGLGYAGTVTGEIAAVPLRSVFRFVYGIAAGKVIENPDLITGEVLVSDWIMMLPATFASFPAWGIAAFGFGSNTFLDENVGNGLCDFPSNAKMQSYCDSIAKVKAVGTRVANAPNRAGIWIRKLFKKKTN